MPGKLRLRGPKDKAVEIKTTVTLERKRQAAKRAAELGVDLATWQRMVVYAALDKGPGGDPQK